LRISLTSACNLKCSYCHNEGQSAPWLQPGKTSARFGNIESLLEVATKYGIKSVKFSGGDPGVYPDLLPLLETIATWRQRFPSIAKWGDLHQRDALPQPEKVRSACPVGIGQHQHRHRFRRSARAIQTALSSRSGRPEVA